MPPTDTPTAQSPELVYSDSGEGEKTPSTQHEELFSPPLSKADPAPRMSKTALLRMGYTVQSERAGKRQSMGTSERANYLHREKMAVPSTKEPVISPRLSKTAMLRMGIAMPEKLVSPQKPQTPQPEKPKLKPRRSSIQPIPSSVTGPPSITPRANRAADLRAKARPSISKQDWAAQRPVTAFGTSYTPNMPNTPTARSPTKPRPSTSLGIALLSPRPNRTKSTDDIPPPRPKTPARPRSSMGVGKSMVPPPITPRTNRAAELRAAMKK